MNKEKLCEAARDGGWQRAPSQRSTGRRQPQEAPRVLPTASQLAPAASQLAPPTKRPAPSLRRLLCKTGTGHPSGESRETAQATHSP